MDAVIEQVLSEIKVCIFQVEPASLALAQSLIENSPRIFMSGAGRSGLCMRAFGIRLMHLGKNVHIVGDTTTPNIQANDLLIFGSGSGRTSGLLLIAEKARRMDAKILLFTTDGGSPLAELADHRVIIPAPTRNIAATGRSIQPMGTLYEQSLMILCDCLVLNLMHSLGVTAGQMRERHANLE